MSAPGPFRVNGFQDRRIRPLCQLSFDTRWGLQLIRQAHLTVQTALFAELSARVRSMVLNRLETLAYYNHLRLRVIPNIGVFGLKYEISDPD